MLLPDTKDAAAEWDRFVASRPDSTFFHLSGWREVIKRSFGHASPYLTAREDGALSAVMPLTEINSRLFGHFLIGNGFTVGGGPIAVDENALSAVLAEAERLGRERKVAYVELRDCPAAGPGWQARDDLYAGFEGPIARDEADNLKQIPRKQRAVVRKALEQGFTISIERNVRPFFDLYARTLRDHGTPILPRRFYENLLTVFGENCEILTVS
jgi:FemAB-related protein (PEP-CTERM system-associated)